MIPCAKRVACTVGAPLIRRAERLARNLPGGYRVKRELINGYILEGRRAGDLLSASVIDPPGRYALLGPNTVSGRIADVVQTANRDAFNPRTPLLEPRIQGDVSPPNARYVLWGNDVAAGAQQLSTGLVSTGRNAAYIADVLVTDTAAWLRVTALPVGAKDRDRSAVISDAIVTTLAPGYSLVAGDVSISNRLQEPLACVAEDGARLYVVTNVFRQVPYTAPSGAQVAAQAALLLITVDLDAMSLTGRLMPVPAIPAEYRPGSITVAYPGNPTYTRVSRSVVLPTDVRKTEAGSVVVSFGYQVEFQDTPVDGLVSPPGSSYPVWIMAVGRATWPVGAAVIVDIFDADALVTTDSQLLVDRGWSVPEIRSHHFPSLLPSGELMDSVAVLGRKAPGEGGAYLPLAPYSEERLDGVVVATAADGFGPLFDDAPDNPDFVRVVSLGISSAHVSKTVTAVRRADATTGSPPSSIGVMFSDGERHRYETLTGTEDGALMFLSCPQQEVRDAGGALVMPSVLVAGFRDGGVDMIGVRKGPVWAEDDAESDPSKYWVFTEAPPSNRTQAPVYLGNPFMTSRHGAYFMEQIDD